MGRLSWGTFSANGTTLKACAVARANQYHSVQKSAYLRTKMIKRINHRLHLDGKSVGIAKGTTLALAPVTSKTTLRRQAIVLLTRTRSYPCPPYKKHVPQISEPCAAEVRG